MGDLRTHEVENLLHVLSHIEEDDVMYDFLLDVFTVREIKEISQRLEVARRLAQGKSYSFIEQETGASATTIARVSKCLSYGSGGYNQALEILMQEESEKDS